MTTLWIARDRDNSLSLFVSKPINHADRIWIPRENVDCGSYINLAESEFPEITWENSPKQLIIK